jgi:hypothetical protein
VCKQLKRKGISRDMRTRIRSKISLLFIVFAALLAIPAVALADNIVDDLEGTATTKTITAGGSFTNHYWIVANSAAGSPSGCDVGVAGDGKTATFQINAPTGVTATPSSVTFDECKDGSINHDQDVVFTSNAPGTYQISVSKTGGTGTYNTNPSDFTLVVNPSPDSTPPDITPNIAGTLGNNGWYTSNVTLSWSVTDPDSTVTSKSGCGTVTITSDQQATTYTCTATSAGGTSSESVSIKRDATDPIHVAGAPDRPADHNGWYNHPVDFTFTGEDATSGIASCSTPTYNGPDGTGKTVDGRCTDKAGNQSALVASSPIDYDETPPTNITFSGISNGDSFDFGAVPAQSSLDCLATDATSGFDSCSIVSGYGTSVGNHTLTAKAFDQAGNSDTKTLSYEVVAWRLSGFYQPVDMNEVVNTVKNGSTVPLKFEVFKQLAGTEFTNTGIINQPLTAKQVSCTAFNGDPIDEIELLATGGTTLRYDSTAGQFIYNWQTPKKPGACYSVTVGTEDGSSIPFAHFKLK